MSLMFIDSAPAGAVNAALVDTIAKAKAEFRTLGYEEEWATGGYGIASIRPLHMQCGSATWAGSHHWGISYATSETWTAWISITMTELAYEVITGMFNLDATPITRAIYMTASGKALPTMNIEEMYAYEISRMFFKKPVVIGPSRPFDFYTKCVGAIATENLGLTGFTIGPHGYLIIRD